MRIIDSHAHYDDAAFESDRYELLDGLFAGDICKIVNIGCSVKSSYSSAELAERYPQIFAAAGLHPDSADEIDRLDDIKALLDRKKVIAVGEIGLDYHYENHSRDIQKRAFEEQLRLAAEACLPVIIHSRDAWEDTMDILRKYRPKGVMHCFSGSAETAEEIVKMGMYVGFTGVVTFKNAKKALRALEAVPIDRLLVETDCPYMAPEPNRGKRNFSGNLPYTIAAMAAVKGVSPEDMAEITAENAERLFNI
ncbi:MAG: TatD family hydrolase [Oscillospiraceae bacterium]|nr:TatD family hydrolase [Oscillospiraceae bacterium]